LELVVVVPTASTVVHGYAVFLGMLLQQGQREAIQAGLKGIGLQGHQNAQALYVAKTTQSAR
jgi:hypothetical protein